MDAVVVEAAGAAALADVAFLKSLQ